MDTPIINFVKSYLDKDMSRLHMPGHKGVAFLGCEPLDITEISGADVLSGAAGVILESEQNTAALFGARHSFYSTGGSSQCIGAMLYLACLNGADKGRPPKILAARNSHKAFFHACALLDLEVDWLYPEESLSYCCCPVSPDRVEEALGSMDALPAGIYVTSPDYLGGVQDIAGLSAVCHRYGVPLLVDNAHGAYLRFLPPSLHPMDLGADLCCDSAHKTLPALTGGAYLHVAKNACAPFEVFARDAMALFGSTSPSYLILQSLDLCVPYLQGAYSRRLADCAAQVTGLRKLLGEKGYICAQGGEPLKLTVSASNSHTGEALALHFREYQVEPEFADRDVLVMMFTPENSPRDFVRIRQGIAALPPACGAARQAPPKIPRAEQVCSIRRAMLGPRVFLPTDEAVGRVCAQPGLSCPPAVPIVAPGERITQALVQTLTYYGTKTIQALK